MTAVTAVPCNNEPNNLKTFSIRISRESDLLKFSTQKSLISKIPSHFTSVFSLYTVPPTKTHRFPERESLSVDSLHEEMCYFKPIKTVPTTPIRRSEAVIIPKAKLAIKEERKLSEKEIAKLSSKSSATKVLITTRVSAFTSVRLVSKIENTKKNQHHKTESESNFFQKKHENNSFWESANSQPRVRVKQGTSIPSNVKQNKKVSKPSPKCLLLEKNKTLKETKTMVTRKKQNSLSTLDIVPTKSVKMIKDCQKLASNRKQGVNSMRSRQPSRNTPPVTRSRLKQTMILRRRQCQKT